MPNQFDGSIKLGVELEVGDVKKNAKELQKEIKDIFHKTDGQELSLQFKTLQTQMNQTYNKSVQLQKKMQELADTSVPTEEYAKLQEDLKETRALYNNMLKTQERIKQIGQEWTKEQADELAELDAKYSELIGKSERLVEAGLAFKDMTQTDEYEQLALALADVNNKMSLQAQKARILQPALQSSQKMVAEYVGDEVLELNGLQSVWGRLGDVASNTLHSIITLLKRSGTAVLQLAKNGITKLISKFKELTHHSNNFGISFKTILRYAFGIRSLFVLFNKVRNAIKDGVNTLAASNGGYNATNAAIRSLTDSLNYLKGALGAAFAPIIQFIAPILTKFIDLLATAANMVGAFFAVLTGKGTIVKATKQTSGLGTASGKAGKAMKDETDQAKKLKSVLAGFDDLDVLNIDDNPMEDLADTLGGGGGAGSGVEFEEINVDQMLPEGLLDWIDRLKEAWANEDWHEVGMIIAEGLNTCFQVVDDWINNTLRPLGVKWAGIIAEILNGVVDGLDWELLGKTIADGLNAIFDIKNTFLEKFNFENFGNGIGRALISAIDNIEWDLIGTYFANKLNALIDTISGIINATVETTTDRELVNVDGIVTNKVKTTTLWESIGNALAEAVNNLANKIKFDKLGETLATGINGVVKTMQTALEKINLSDAADSLANGLKKLVTEVDFNAIGELINDGIVRAIMSVAEFVGDIDWSAVGSSLIRGLIDIMNNIDIDEISAALFTALVSIVTSAFDLLLGAVAGLNLGIGDLFKDMGVDSVAGFLLGVGESVAEIGTWIQENFVDPFVNAVKELLGIQSPSTVFEEIGINIIEGLYNGIISMIDSIVQRFQQLRDDLINVLEDFKLRAKTKWEEIKTTIHTVVDALKQGAIDKFNDLKAKVIEIKENLKTKLNTIWTAIKTNIETWVNTIKTNAETKFTEMKDKLQELMDTAKEKVVGAWSNMWSGIKTKINTIIGGVEKFANAIVDAINKVIEALNALGSVDIPANPFLPEGLHFGLSIPTLGHISIPRLAQGAVIPPNKEFLAMLGDQQRGVNIEAPLDTIVEAFRDVVANMQVENTGASEMVLDGEVFARLITPYVISELERSGYNVEVLEGNV